MSTIVSYQGGTPSPNPMNAGEVMTRASVILLDEQFVRWEKPELAMWINDAAREIVSRKRSARAVTVTLALDEGAMQTLPERTIMLMDVVRSISAKSRAVRRVDRQLMDDTVPGWYSQKPSATIKHFMFDERTPTTMYVWPPAAAGAQVECLLAQSPPEVASEGDTLDLSSEYLNLVLAFVVYRAFSKDSEYANGTVAAAHYQLFLDGLSDSTDKIAVNSPNVNSV